MDNRTGSIAAPVVSSSRPQRVAPRAWGAHRSIAAAIRSADDGAVITISAGVYTESVLLDKSVVLVAEPGGGPVEIAASFGIAVVNQGATATLRGLTIRAAEGEAIAVSVHDGRLILEECEIIGGRVDLAGWAVADLNRCRLHHCSVTALHARGDATLSLTGCVVSDIDGAGLVLSESTSTEMTETTVSRCAGPGLFLRERAIARLTDCELAETAGAGLVTDGTAGLLAIECRLRDVIGDGIQAGGSSPLAPTPGSGATDWSPPARPRCAPMVARSGRLGRPARAPSTKAASSWWTAG